MALIIANILSFIGNSLFTLSTIFKSKRNIVLSQSGNHILLMISEILTTAYAGLVQEITSLIRNILFLFINVDKKIIKIIISAVLAVIATTVGVIINIYYSDNIWYGYIPIFCGLMYSIVIIIVFSINFDENNSELILKISLLVSSIGWALYGFLIMLYPVFGFNVLNIILCIISIVRICIKKKKTDGGILEDGSDN